MDRDQTAQGPGGDQAPHANAVPQGGQGRADPAQPGEGATDDRWVTLREAEALTGAKVATLRKWYRAGAVASRVETGPYGEQRLVRLADVRARQRGPGAPPPAPAPPAAATPKPEDAILVPVDAWRRMLDQLGNLHQAGQQLADARERAAKAETEAAFLRERLAEQREREAALRAELERTRAEQGQTRAPDRPPAPAAQTPEAAPEQGPRRPWWRVW